MGEGIGEDGPGGCGGQGRDGFREAGTIERTGDEQDPFAAYLCCDLFGSTRIDFQARRQVGRGLDLFIRLGNVTGHDHGNEGIAEREVQMHRTAWLVEGRCPRPGGKRDGVALQLRVRKGDLVEPLGCGPEQVQLIDCLRGADVA